MAHTEDLWLRDGKPRPRHGQGRRYRVRYVDPDGAERSRSFTRKTDATAFEIDVAADLQRGHYRDPKAGKVTLRKYAEQWLDSRTFGESTRETVEQRLRLHILPALGGKAVAQISPSTVQAWLRGLDAAPSTAGVLLSLLSAIMRAAADDGLIAANPCKAGSVKAPKVERRRIEPWSAEQVAAIRAGLPEQYAAMADCGSGLGMRQGEVLGLAVGDVDFLHRVAHVRRQVKRVGGRLVFGPPKGLKERTVPLPESVALALAEHIRQHPPQAVTLPWQAPGGKAVTASLLFTTSGGRAISRNAWNETAWHPALCGAGLTPSREAGFHQLRHHYASALLAGGVDIKSVAEALGHHDASFTLKVYAHVMPDSADRIRSAIDTQAASPAATRAPIPIAAAPPGSLSDGTRTARGAVTPR